MVATPDEIRVEETLDPPDWEATRTLAHTMVDDIFDYLQTVRERPLWQPIPDEVKAAYREPLPVEGQGLERTYEDFARYVLPYPMGNIHPRFWGWVIGTGSIGGMMAEMLAAGMNPNAGGGDHAASYIEATVLDWCKTMLGFPSDASGLLVSGGSMANLIGLQVARNVKAAEHGIDLRVDGVDASKLRLRMYASTEAHSSIQRAAEALGLGSNAIRFIPPDTAFRFDVAALERAIAEDIAVGWTPFAVVGSAANVSTGSIDPLDALADVCEREGLWFHVDGAIGAVAVLSPELRPLLKGMERADSLAFDMHKWLYIPYEAGCVLVRSAKDHYRTFTLTPEYLKHAERGIAAGAQWFSDYGLQLSRGFKALKVWMSLKEHGVEKYGRLIQQNVDQAQYLTRLIDAEPRLERLAPTALNIVTFRYRADGLDDAALDALNAEILMRLQESGIAAPSTGRVNGKFVIRCAITNHRSRFEDFDLFIDEVLRIGDELRG